MESRYGKPEEDFTQSMREMYAGVEVGTVPDYAFYAFEALENDTLVGLVRQDAEGRIAYADPERGGWLTPTNAVDVTTLELISIGEAESQARQLRVGLEDDPIGTGRAPVAEQRWAYFEFVFSDGTREGLIRRSKPYTIQRLTEQGWRTIPRLENLFTVGVGGDQGEVGPVSVEEARRRARARGFDL